MAAGVVPRSRYAVFSGIAGGGCLADLLTKYWVFHWLCPAGLGNEVWLIPNFVAIQPSTNAGALFGMAPGYAPLFALLSVGAFIGIVWWLFAARAAHDRWLTVALGCISAGIFGNLYDRLGLWSPPWAPHETIREVRDWILFCYYDHLWPNFNLADSFLVCGAIMLVVHALWFSKPKTAE